MDQQSEKITREYLDFLDDEQKDNIYNQLIKSMIETGKQRLYVNINDLRRNFPERAISLLNNCFEEQVCFQMALKQFIKTTMSESIKDDAEFFIGFEGSFGNKHVTPRTLTSRFLGNLVCVEGIVTKCSLVRPKVVKSVHYCPTTKTVTERSYTDLTSFEAFPQSAVYPTTDKDGHPLETEFGLCCYKDHQTVTIQEMPEKAPTGQLPRSIDVICDNDLVDLCKPGDRIQVVGSYRCLPGKHGGYTSGTFRTVLLANNIMQLSQEATLVLNRSEITECKKLAERHRKNIFELLSKSLAPSIHGQEYVKKAILCLLLGGVEKMLPNGTRLRGDINVLLIGDPSVAKSQLLRYVLSTAPRAIPTTGRGSSGVGLTAAVTVDQETGERRLEAGAMVLADRGVICIDEFDKMSDIDRTAIHEVMEQGKVTIAKAGIHASLNARCSVLAAANPVYGRYDQYKTPMENIGLQDSLLSRFDLLFVMLDVIDSEQDHVISEHVMRMHRYRHPTEQEGEALSLGGNLDMLTTGNPDKESVEEKQIEIYQKYDPLLHGKSRTRSEKILNMNFMKKYIHFARAMKPKLTEEASEVIADEYSRLRSEDMLESHVARTQPVTVRTLETLIRLSTAHAKARLSRTVTVEDAQAAIELIQFAYFKRVLEKEKKRRRRDSDASEINEHNGEPQQIDANNAQPKHKRTKRGVGSEEVDPYQYESDDDTHLDGAGKKVVRSEQLEESRSSSGTVTTTKDLDSSKLIAITDERLNIFKKVLDKMFTDQRTSSLSLDYIRKYFDSQERLDFTNDEIEAALAKMSENDMIMIDDDIVMRI